MTPYAYYNEIDEYAAQWLRNLIKAGHIAPGFVDERSIIDVRPYDLKDFTQCHFFAGVGVWSYALRRAGWPDSRPVWTGSCPCQPFSAAGAGAGFDDERHLWPAFFHLISQCEPERVYGEQVASKDADPWLDLVHADMESLGYAFGACAFPSAGVGAPHIRDRTYWVADNFGFGRERRRVDHSSVPQIEQREAPLRQFNIQSIAGLRATSRLGDDDDARLEGYGGGYQAESGRDGAIRPVAEASEFSGVADHNVGGREVSGLSTEWGERENKPLFGGGGENSQYSALTERSGIIPNAATSTTGPTNGLWRAADWLLCRDGRWRPVEPGAFPLAYGVTSRVGRLRAYGNAINASAAQVFIESTL